MADITSISMTKTEIRSPKLTADQIQFGDQVLDGVSNEYGSDSENMLASTAAVKAAYDHLYNIFQQFFADINIERDNALISNVVIDSYFSSEESDWENNNFTFSEGQATFVGTGAGTNQARLRVNPDYLFANGDYFIVAVVNTLESGSIRVSTNGNDDITISSAGVTSILFDITDSTTANIDFIVDDVESGDSVVIDTIFVHRIHDQLTRYLDWKFDNFDFSNAFATFAYVDQQDSLLQGNIDTINSELSARITNDTTVINNRITSEIETVDTSIAAINAILPTKSDVGHTHVVDNLTDKNILSYAQDLIDHDNSADAHKNMMRKLNDIRGALVIDHIEDELPTDDHYNFGGMYIADFNSLDEIDLTKSYGYTFSSVDDTISPTSITRAIPFDEASAIHEDLKETITGVVIDTAGVTEEVVVAQDSGTVLGNMTEAGGLSTAFNGITNLVHSSCARVTAASGTIGKKWDDKKTIVGFSITGSNNYGFADNSSTVGFVLQGSNDGSTWTDLYTNTSFTDTNTSPNLTVTSGITEGAYHYHRFLITVSTYSIFVAEITFTEKISIGTSTGHFIDTDGDAVAIETYDIYTTVNEKIQPGCLVTTDSGDLHIVDITNAGMGNNEITFAGDIAADTHTVNGIYGTIYDNEQITLPFTYKAHTTNIAPTFTGTGMTETVDSVELAATGTNFNSEWPGYMFDGNLTGTPSGWSDTGVATLTFPEMTPMSGIYFNCGGQASYTATSITVEVMHSGSWVTVVDVSGLSWTANQVRTYNFDAVYVTDQIRVTFIKAGVNRMCGCQIYGGDVLSPINQYYYTNLPLSELPNIIDINSISIDTTIDTSSDLYFAISFDNGTTYQVNKGSGWTNVSNPVVDPSTSYMTLSEISTITDESLGRTDELIRLIVVFTTSDAADIPRLNSASLNIETLPSSSQIVKSVDISSGILEDVKETITTFVVDTADTSGHFTDGTDSIAIKTIYTSPAYTNTGGTGNRTSIIAVSSSNLTFSTTSDESVLVNGTVGSGSIYSVAISSPTTFSGNEAILFDFGDLVVIDNFRFATTGGTQPSWKWQASVDNSEWVDVSAEFQVTNGGVVPATITGNYRYYRMLGIAGSTCSTAWIDEVEFSIAPAQYTSINEKIQIGCQVKTPSGNIYLKDISNSGSGANEVSFIGTLVTGTYTVTGIYGVSTDTNLTLISEYDVSESLQSIGTNHSSTISNPDNAFDNNTGTYASGPAYGAGNKLYKLFGEDVLLEDLTVQFGASQVMSTASFEYTTDNGATWNTLVASVSFNSVATVQDVTDFTPIVCNGVQITELSGYSNNDMFLYEFGITGKRRYNPVNHIYTTRFNLSLESSIDQLNSFIVSVVENSSNAKYAISTDGGTTYHAWNGSSYVVVDVPTDDVSSWMTEAVFEGLETYPVITGDVIIAVAMTATSNSDVPIISSMSIDAIYAPADTTVEIPFDLPNVIHEDVKETITTFVVDTADTSGHFTDGTDSIDVASSYAQIIPTAAMVSYTGSISWYTNVDDLFDGDNDIVFYAVGVGARVIIDFGEGNEKSLIQWDMGATSGTQRETTSWDYAGAHRYWSAYCNNDFPNAGSSSGGWAFEYSDNGSDWTEVATIAYTCGSVHNWMEVFEYIPASNPKVISGVKVITDSGDVHIASISNSGSGTDEIAFVGTLAIGTYGVTSIYGTNNINNTLSVLSIDEYYTVTTPSIESENITRFRGITSAITYNDGDIRFLVSFDSGDNYQYYNGSSWITYVRISAGGYEWYDDANTQWVEVSSAQEAISTYVASTFGYTNSMSEAVLEALDFSDYPNPSTGVVLSMTIKTTDTSPIINTTALTADMSANTLVLEIPAPSIMTVDVSPTSSWVFAVITPVTPMVAEDNIKLSVSKNGGISWVKATSFTVTEYTSGSYLVSGIVDFAEGSGTDIRMRIKFNGGIFGILEAAGQAIS